MAKTKASAKQLDFTKVKEGGMFSKKRQPAGDYLGKVTKVVDAKAKSDGADQWLFTIDVNGQTYPYYCKHTENQLWKIRNLCVAAGINIPKKRVKVDPNSVVGKEIGVTLEDDEYEGKLQSNVSATFPPSELDPSALANDDDEPPTPSKKGKKSKKDEPVEKVSGKAGKKGKKGKKSKDDELDEIDVDDI